MKNIKKYIIAYSLLLLTTACSDLTELNVNPSFPTDVPANTLINPIEQYMYQGLAFDGRYIGKYIQNFSNSTAFLSWDRYGNDPVPSENGAETWRVVYTNIGLNLSEVQQQAIEQNRYDVLGFSKVIRAWSWQTCTDHHGEIIAFDQVFTARASFDYVTQDKVYDEVVRLLKEGITDLSRTDGGVNQAYFAVGDKIYNGDRSKWIKFAYGVLARNASNLINKANYDPAKVIEYCDKSLANSSDDAYLLNNGTVSADTNFWGPLRGNMNNFRQTDFVVRTMDGSIFTGAIDPRMFRMLSPSKGASETAPATATNPDPTKYLYLGNPLNTAAATSGTSQIPNPQGLLANAVATDPGRYVFKNTAKFPLMTYMEIQFIKAEAAFIKGDKAMALDAYKKGIEASFDFVNLNTIARTTYPITTLITATERTAFLSNAAIIPTATNLTISQIMLQKYIALWGIGYIETWNDFRKYHYDPAVYTSLNTAGNIANGGNVSENFGKLPYRLRNRYASEYQWNYAAILSIGGEKVDYITKEMWFSQK